MHRQRQRLERHAGGGEREGGPDPGEEGALVGEREARVGLVADGVDPAREPRRGGGTGHGGRVRPAAAVR